MFFFIINCHNYAQLFYILEKNSNNTYFCFTIQKFPIIMRNLEKCPECWQRFHVEWQGKSFSQKRISLILNRLIPQKVDFL
jgi:hypothetical protein